MKPLLTPEILPRDVFQTEYTPLGLRIPTSMDYSLPANKHGVDNPVEDLDINKKKFRILQPSGDVDSVNDEFAFDPKPTVIVSDGSTLREGFGWSWNNFGVATMDTPPSTDLYGLI